MSQDSSPPQLFGSPAAGAARAPGRVNLIGEHTDYNGGLVLPAAIGLATRVSVRFRADDRVRAVSRERGAEEARLDAPASGRWLDYGRGVALRLARERRIPFAGFDAAVESEVPEGAGLSSSAALAAGFALALLAAAGAPLRRADRPALARLVQQAEGEFVGVPCGLMDPYAILCGERDAALLLDCSTEKSEIVPLPEDLLLLVIDTGVKRELRDGGFAQRRAECERALAQARDALRRELFSLSSLKPTDLGPLGGRIDPVAFRRVRHVVSENARVREFATRLRAGDLRGAGDVLYASHESLRVDYQVTCPESDMLAAGSRDLPGCIGARMTGAGWGGCTIHLVERARAAACAASLVERFAARFGHTPRHWLTRPAAPATRLLP